MEHSKPSFIFNLEGSHTGDAQARKLEWARRVFAEPVQVASSTNIDWLDRNCSEPEVEASVYTNLQKRDSEIGVHLLGRRKTELRESIQVIRQSLSRRERDAATARTRIDTMKKINVTEPNRQLRYSSQVLDQIEAQMATDVRESAYLRKKRVLLDGLALVLRTFDEGEKFSRVNEQLMRLLGQSFRAQTRVWAFAHNFRDSLKERLPNLEPYGHDKGFGGYLLPLSSNTPPIAIDRNTAGYLLHFLETISLLAEISAEQLHIQSKQSADTWFPLLALLRSIVEFFYVCNFELPYFYTDLFMDTENTKMLWSFDQEHQNWQSVAESTDTSRYLKRISAETALMITENGPLLKCRTPDDLNRFLKREAQPVTEAEILSETKFHPYISCGLAEFDLDPSNQRTKFRTTFAPVGTILECIIDGQESCKRIAGSALGGPLETLLGLAELDPRAFGLGEAQTLKGPLEKLERFRLLSRFWRATSRRRAISMLGEEYTNKVAAGLEVLGEPGPEHPTFISISLKPAIARISLSQGEEIADPFGSLNIADQVRLIEMLNITWSIAAEFLNRLKDVHSQGKLKRIIEGLPQLIAGQQEELHKRYNPKLVQSDQWVLSLLRGIAPSLWDFWIKIGDGTPWVEPFLSVPPLQGLSLLLRLFCETARLILLVEVSGSGLGERLEIDAESAGQQIMSGVHGYLEGEHIPIALAGTIDGYFDPEVLFDSWLAFTSSFQAHLRQMEGDMRAMNAGALHIKSLTAILGSLSLLYPSDGVDKADDMAVTVMQVTAESHPTALQEQGKAIAEKDAELFSRIYFDLLDMPEGEAMVFLKLLSMVARQETKPFLQQADRINSIITDLLPERHQRLLLLTLPEATSTFFGFLQSLKDEKDIENGMLETFRARSAAYFDQLGVFSQKLIDWSAKTPYLLPEDSEALGKFLKATSPINRDLSFLLIFAGDQLVMDICTSRTDRSYQLEAAMGKIQAFMRKQIDKRIESSSLELFPVGGGLITCRDRQFFLSGHNESFELSFSEPDRAMSNYLLSRVASIKFSFAAQILRQEFPKINFIAQV
jgi:hypothetical protein